MTVATMNLTERRARDEDVARAHTLFDCFAAITERGLEAVAAGDFQGVDDAVGARQDLIRILDDVFGSLLDPSGPATQRSADDLNALRDHAEAVHVTDAKLKLALGAERQRLAHEIDALDDEEAIRSAYGQTQRTDGRTINIVR
ncbi:MAG: hypothetical protein WD737_03325 [Gemmatimonadota bacterium]